MDGVCAFCNTQRELRESHVLPAFVFRWLRKRSGGQGHLRNTENPNRRVQDGLKLHWLCDECEGLFNEAETKFATHVFNQWKQGQSYRFPYEAWLLKFCVSVSWRVLNYARSHGRGGTYSEEQQKLLDLAEERWKHFLLDKVPHPAEFEQHLVIFDLANESSLDDLPTNFNRFMTGAVTLDIVGSERSLMTYAKMGPFTLFGIIQKGPNAWQGTRVCVRSGILRPGKIVLPVGLLDLFKEKAQLAEDAMSNMSKSQQDKVDENILSKLDDFAGSEQFKAIMADVEMFGKDAVLPKRKP